MRRFFRSSRDEDFSQIQYLTAKCGRLSHENAVLERQCLLAKDGNRTLQLEVEALALQLRQREQASHELQLERERLRRRLKDERELVQALRRRERAATEESGQEAALLSLQLEQVNGEVQLLLGSEAQLEGLVDELHVEAQDLEMQLHSKTCELKELQGSHAAQSQELEELRSSHQRTVEELRHEKDGSLRKLCEMAEQFEMLCEQQRAWMGCVKRFKKGLLEQKQCLILQVHRLQVEVQDLRMNPQARLQDPDDMKGPSFNRVGPWDPDTMADLRAEVERWRGMYEELFNKLTPLQNQKPP
ncbi:hyaluronan mediated motility receptor [Denticeps clupeoides]|uniref:hyaluronan mediated motility receptor n=1 Tax=Denticeps clupeoides TaxID=299321 RepID=UPI0010A35F30|nr:hyaluronan mediated motility receptor-like [Denticeps clupeoides]